MTKKNIKQILKEHKKEIIGGVIVIGCLAAGYAIGIKQRNEALAFIEDDVENTGRWVQFFNDLDKAKEGCTAYIPINAEDFKTLTNGNGIISCDDATELLDVKNLIAFGNIV